MRVPPTLHVRPVARVRKPTGRIPGFPKADSSSDKAIGNEASKAANANDNQKLEAIGDVLICARNIF